MATTNTDIARGTPLLSRLWAWLMWAPSPKSEAPAAIDKQARDYGEPSADYPNTTPASPPLPNFDHEIQPVPMPLADPSSHVSQAGGIFPSVLRGMQAVGAVVVGGTKGLRAEGAPIAKPKPIRAESPPLSPPLGGPIKSILPANAPNKGPVQSPTKAPLSPIVTTAKTAQPDVVYVAPQNGHPGGYYFTHPADNGGNWYDPVSRTIKTGPSK